MGLTLALGLILPRLILGNVCRTWAGRALMAPAWVPGAIIALVDAGFALRLTSPTKGELAEVVLVVVASLVTFAIWPWGADAMTLTEFLHALALNAAVAGPGLVISLILLRRGASQHPFASGLGTGFAMGGAHAAVKRRAVTSERRRRLSS